MRRRLPIPTRFSYMADPLSSLVKIIRDELSDKSFILNERWVLAKAQLGGRRMVKKLNPAGAIEENAAAQLRKTDLTQVLWKIGFGAGMT